MHRRGSIAVFAALLLFLALCGFLQGPHLQAQDGPLVSAPLSEATAQPTPAIPLDDKALLLREIWEKSTKTGPTPPPGVDVQGLGAASLAAHVISGVPAYIWHHGCGPTAAGMVIGYWDIQGYSKLVVGTAFSQTTAVNEMIASDGLASNYSDYCLPLDHQGIDPSPLPDLSEPPAGDEHPDECLADFMKTSQSAWGHFYGGTTPSREGPAMVSYAHLVAPSYVVTTSYLEMGNHTLNWAAFCAEIDAGRPMVFIVDTDADGRLDHAVTAVGYDDGGGAYEPRYACLNTWDSTIHWWVFQPVAPGHQWGVYAGTTFAINMSVPGDPYEPNEDLAHARPIACGSTISATIDPLRDVDYYSFTGAAGTPVVADIDAWVNGSYLDTELGIYSGGGSILAYSYDSGGSPDPRIEWTLRWTTTYYLMVKSESLDLGSGEPYVLSLSCVPAPVIAAAPGSFEVTLAEKQIVSRTMAVSNTGGGLLTFAITESATIWGPGTELPLATGTRAQGYPAVANNTQNGDYLVVWEEAAPSADLYAQRIASSGQLLGGTIAVCTDEGMQERPVVAYNSQRKEYLVVWQSGTGEGAPFGPNYIHGQRIAWDGEPEGGLIRICEATDWQIHPDVAYNSQSDEYLVVWQNGVVDIVSQRVGGSGQLLGDPLPLCEAPRMQRSPSVAYNPHTNEYLVVWDDYRNSSDYDLYGVRLSATWPWVTEIQPYQQAGDQLAPEVTFCPATNEYWVAWSDESVSPVGLYVQRVSETGDLLGSAVDLSGTATGRRNPGLVFDPLAGEYLVVWSEGEPSDIHARKLSDLAVPSGDPFPISAAAGDQSLPAIALHPASGNYLVAWQDSRSGSSTDIYAYMRTSSSVVSDAPWLAATPVSGTVSAGVSVPVWVSFDSTVVPTGTHTATLFVASDDLHDTQLTIPVTLHVESGVPLYLAPPDTGADVYACTGTFTFALQVQDVADLGGLGLTFAFDPNVVHVQDIALGSLITSSARPFTLAQQIDNVLGQASLDAASSGLLPGPSGSGPLAVITFSPVHTGTTALALQQAQLTNTGGAVIAVVSTDGSATVLPALDGDLDCDCDADIVDIMLVASRWGTVLDDPRYDPQYDLDGDGDIDIVDIMLVVMHWSETCTGAAVRQP